MCYDEFPLSTVIYHAVTLGGAIAAGVAIAAQFGLGATVGYLLLLVFALVGVLATICARCGYFDRRCAMGLGKVAALIFDKGQEEEFFRTGAQFAVLVLLVLLLLLPIGGGLLLLARGFSAWRLATLLAMAGLLLAGLVPHPQLVCGHCCQGERGVCPVGRQFWRTRPAEEE